MCEWLSCSEWCDVQLLCGGRVFSAHRAVLASVSAFLRSVLLSCPVEESPTFIVLPDFDLEAMSSVLYYIYNGEVVIQKQKLDMFLEIIKAMQIFIDHQYLPKIYDELYDGNLDKLSLYSDSNLSKNNIFTLKSENSKDQKYVNIKKGQQILDSFSKDALSFQDKRIRCQNWSEQSKSPGNMQPPYGDRQKSSFLRDSFIETYPRNGNANGLTTGVPAISNERYRDPSVLLTNANDNHPAADNVFLNTKRTTDLTSTQTTLRAHKELNCNYYKYRSRNYFNELYAPSLFKNFSPAYSNMHVFSENGARERDSWMNYCSWQIPVHTMTIQQQLLIRSKDLNVAHTLTNFSSSSTSVSQNFDGPVIDEKAVAENKTMSSNDSSTRVAILNKVLESPWCPRLSYSYKPFRKKDEKSTLHGEFELEEMQNETLNDSNNNVQSSELKVPNDISENNISNNAKETSAVPCSITCAIGKENFKCDVCNQVFTNSDSLTVHRRRHSSTARYTCGECGKTFSQLRNFKYHMSVHRGTREFAATCTVCGKYFNDRGYLSSHMKIHRNRKEYKCSLCPKSFNQRVAYNMHVRIHTGVKPHVCDQCGKAFSRKMLLKQHQRTHSGERPYACPHCDKRFADRSNMTLHLRLHTGVKPFSCSLCPKSFTKKHHLKSHLNFHTGAKPYSCPRCNLAFTQSSNMRTHMKKCNAPERDLAVSTG